MPYGPPKPIDMRFPVRGVDRSLPARDQPALTTYECLNVRAFPPSSDRLGGGTREGFTKLFESQAADATNRRITGLEVLSESRNVTDPSAYSSSALAEDWSTQSVADPANLGDNWHPIEIDDSSGRVTLHSSFSINGSQQLLLDLPGGDWNAVMCSYFVDQPTGVTLVVNGNAQASTANNGYNTGGVTKVGPVIGASNNNQTGLMACIVAVGTNQVQCKIYSYNGASFTEEATSTTVTLTGSATATDWTITITRTGGAVVGTFTATGVVSGPADLNVTVNATTALTGNRGGLGLVPASNSTTNARTIQSVSLTRLIPPANTVYSTVDPTVANPIDGNQFYLPSDFIGISRTAAGALTVTSAGPTSATDPDWPAIDDSNDTIIVTNPDGSNGDFGDEINWALYTVDTEQYGVVLRVDSTQFDDNEDIGAAVFRASQDGRNALFILPSAVRDANTGMIRIAGIKGIAIVDNVATDLGLIEAIVSNKSLFWFNEVGSYRITDDGTNINIYVNGVLLYSFNVSSFPNWTAGIGTGLDGNTGTGFTGGSDATDVSNSIAEFGKVEIVQGEGTTSATLSNIKNKLLILSPAAIDLGDTAALTISSVTGLVLQQPLPESASFNSKFYAVDGERDIIVNPATLVSSDWASQVTDGTLPDGCGLIAFFRGSCYLAATDSDPTIWYKSRTLDPLDWDYGADPQVSSAVAGNNGEVGQPADAITALIPFSDDYLVFGMARSIGVLEGDPGYGGQFQIVSREAGIAGARAYCFDDRGSLYFIGAGGLYMMPRGSFNPEPVGPRKLRRALEEINLATNLIQLGFRPSDRTVRIHITPNDGTTVGTHIIYDTRTEGFFLDKYPVDFGPWSIAQTSGVADIDRNIIIGGNDGYIRRPDDDALSDDGTAILSYVDIILPQQDGGLTESMCQELQFVMEQGGSGVQWYWFTGDSPEDVRPLSFLNNEHVATGVFNGTGWKDPVGLRETGAAHKITIGAQSAVNRWAMERITAMIATTTTRRR